jgi:signal transduction histidine kinase
VGQALASGALAVDAPRSLEPGEVFASLEARIEAALGDGYTALRIVGPATWTLARGSGLEKWIEVEEELKRLFGERQLVGIWQYDRSGSSPGLLRTFLRMHPFVIVGGEVHPNCLFVPPGRPAGTGPAPDELDRALDAVLERARADELAAAGRFTVRIAHEINNPLAWITTNLGFMKEVLQRFAGASAPPSPEEVSQVLEALQETEEGASRIREFVETLRARPGG